MTNFANKEYLAEWMRILIELNGIWDGFSTKRTGEKNITTIWKDVNLLFFPTNEFIKISGYGTSLYNNTTIPFTLEGKLVPETLEVSLLKEHFGKITTKSEYIGSINLDIKRIKAISKGDDNIQLYISFTFPKKIDKSLEDKKILLERESIYEKYLQFLHKAIFRTGTLNITNEIIDLAEDYRKIHGVFSVEHNFALTHLNIPVELWKKREETTTNCIVCCEKKINCAFIPCGHTVSCHNCALKINKCPICREESGILKLYF